MRKILVIEDEKIVQLNITKILQFEGFDVSAAPNGETGIQLAKEQRPDLILCDIMMPYINGYDVQAELQLDPDTKLIPFIFLTAKAERSDLRLGMNLGANDYLTKPFTSEELLEAIFSCLDRQETMQQHFQDKVDQIKHNITGCFPERLFLPLERIRSFLEVLDEQANDQLPIALQSELQDSCTALKSLDRFLQNFMLYSFLETTKGDPQKIDALTQNCITSTAKIISQIANDKAIEYSRESDLKLQVEPCQISMLEGNWMNVLEELLDNAMRFSPMDSEIYVQSSLDAGQMTLQITNPMNDESLKASASNNRTGLGLAIVKQLIDLHQGQLSCGRTLEGLFSVTIRMPVASEEKTLAVV